MTSLGSSTVSEKYSSLRKRLDNFGYRQPLGLESLQLVERLFSDLVHTTESLRKQKEEAGKLTQHRGNVEAHVEPFKQDNARLVRENNEIHMQLIKQKEHFEEQLKGTSHFRFSIHRSFEGCCTFLVSCVFAH